MEDEDTCRRRAEALLKAAAETENMKLRGELIDQAAHWHNRAMASYNADRPSAADDAEDPEPQGPSEQA